MTTLKNRANRLPELFYMPDYDFLEWAANGMLKDISSYVTEEELSEAAARLTRAWKQDAGSALH